MKETVS